MKSYNDINKQVNRIITSYLVDEYSQPHSDRHAAIVRKVRDIQHRYTFNINRAEGFCTFIELDGGTRRMSWAEAKRIDYGAIYHVYKSEVKRYPRRVYAGY